MTDDQIRDLLREMRDDPVPADSLARVRRRVEDRTAERRVRWWIPLAAAVAVASIVLVFWLRHPAAVPVAAPVPTMAEMKVVEPPLPVAKARPVQRIRPVPRVLNGTAIRIETADPDVVLIMVTEGGGE